MSTAISPDNSLKAVTFLRNCGVLSSYSAGVSVIPLDQDLPSADANVLAFDDTIRTDGRVLKSLSVAWSARDMLIVTHDPRARIVTQASVVRMVRIRYLTPDPEQRRR